ncbi:MAG: extracellular solute-binding protein [Chitinivibrionales bacterium]|nr:extracellular solute-binding protein [Chitinivibrionales bacterium]
MKLSKMFAAAIAVVLGMSGCARKTDTPTITILLRMMPAQERFLRDEIVPAFEKEHDCKVQIANFDNQWDIERLLRLENEKKNPEIDIVKTPFEMTRVLVDKGYIQELTTVTDSPTAMQDLAEYHQLASGLGYIDGKPFYIPRKLESRILFYRKSMVADAIAKYAAHKQDIDTRLKALNGKGFPADYQLEAEPGEWDFFDLFAVGHIWANETYNGVKMGRIAHRGAPYGGTALFLIDRALQLGASKEKILEFTADEVSEMFMWEHVFVKEGLYNMSMWQDKWKGSDIYNGIKDGKVFLAYLQQIDCFNVHGWEDDLGMPGYLPEKGDMGLAVVPQAVSLDLNDEGEPQISGSRAISTGGWWWGIPQTSSHKRIAYKLIRYITNKENQANECSKFGMIPVRKDLLANVPEVFEQGWVGDIYRTSVEQLKINELTTVPLVENYADVARRYVDAWQKLCIEYDEQKDGEMNVSTMKMRLASDFASSMETP